MKVLKNVHNFACYDIMNEKITGRNPQEKWDQIKSKVLCFIYALVWVLLVCFSLFYTDLADCVNSRVQSIEEVRDIPFQKEEGQAPLSESFMQLENKVNKVVVPVLIAFLLFLADYVYGDHEGKQIWVGTMMIIMAIILSLILNFGWLWFLIGIFFVLFLLKWHYTPLMPAKEPETKPVVGHRPSQRSLKPQK